jgi:hypothetical protein
MVATSRDFTLYIAKTAMSGLGDELHDLVTQFVALTHTRLRWT